MLLRLVFFHTWDLVTILYFYVVDMVQESMALEKKNKVSGVFLWRGTSSTFAWSRWATRSPSLLPSWPTPRHLEDKESVESINHWWLLEESLVVNIPKLLSEGQVCGWISEIHS